MLGALAWHTGSFATSVLAYEILRQHLSLTTRLYTDTQSRVHGVIRRSAWVQCVPVYVLSSPAATAMEVPRAQAIEEREVKTDSRGLPDPLYAALPEVFRKEAPVKSQSSRVVSTCIHSFLLPPCANYAGRIQKAACLLPARCLPAPCPHAQLLSFFELLDPLIQRRLQTSLTLTK